MSFISTLVEMSATENGKIQFCFHNLSNNNKFFSIIRLSNVAISSSSSTSSMMQVEAFSNNDHIIYFVENK